MLDRTKQPLIYTTDNIQFPDYQKHTLKNGIELYAIPYGKQAVLKLEILLNAGSKFDQKNGASFFATRMLTEGTTSHSAKDIAELSDRFGASLEASSNLETANITLFCLSKHLGALLPLVYDIWQNSNFPIAELEQIKNITTQSLNLQLEKSAYLATKAFKKQIFGSEHPIAKAIEPADIDAIQNAEIIDFYRTYIKQTPAKLFLSGNITAADIELVSATFERINTKAPQKRQLLGANIAPSFNLIKKKDARQSSIRVGRRLFSRKHADFFKFLVANEILGGYFGSRLMKNIREDKGYTYGINASFVPVGDQSYWAIGSDVKLENTSDTLEEIKNEIKVLQTQAVPEEELLLVKNLMIGTMAAGLNTPFEVADRLRMLIYNDLPEDFFTNYPNNIRSVNADDILLMANTYMADLHEVVVGGI
jgi:zinc protease